MQQNKVGVRSCKRGKVGIKTSTRKARKGQPIGSQSETRLDFKRDEQEDDITNEAWY